MFRPTATIFSEVVDKKKSVVTGNYITDVQNIKLRYMF